MKKTTRNVIIAVVSVVVLVGVLFVVMNFMPQSTDDTTGPTYPTDENGEQYATDAKGNVIPSVKDADGNIISAGEVVLTEKGPLALAEIDVQNDSGQYTIKSEVVELEAEQATDAEGNPTGETQTNQYTIVGYEDAGVNSGGQTAAIANSISNLTTLDIIDINGENLEDYGLDKPQAVVTGKYSDGTENVMKIGNDAAGGQETYMQYGDEKAVYLVSRASIEPFFYSPLELISLEVNASATSSEELIEPVKVTLTGTNYPEKVVLVVNDDMTTEAYFKMTSPEERPANIVVSSEIMGSVKGLNATEVLAYNPTDDQMKEYGLDNPKSKIVADFDGETITMSASDIDEEGLVTVYSYDKDIIYAIDQTLVRWATTSFDELKYEYIAKPVDTYVDSIKVTVDGKTYTYKVGNETVTDDEGNETTQLTATADGEEVNSVYFETFYQNLTGVMREESSDGLSKQGDAVLTVEYIYNNDKESDKIEYYDAGSRKYIAQVNGQADGVVYETYIKQIEEDVKALANNERVNPI